MRRIISSMSNGFLLPARRLFAECVPTGARDFVGLVGLPVTREHGGKKNAGCHTMV